MKTDKRKQLKDYAGQRFGLLTAQRPTQILDTKGVKRTFWFCLCSGCGRQVCIRQNSLARGAQFSRTCGCRP